MTDRRTTCQTKRAILFLAAVFVNVCTCSPVMAQQPLEDLAGWEFYKAVVPPERHPEAKYAGFFVDEEVFAHASESLWDLRLVRGSDRQEVPFALRQLSGASHVEWFEGTVLNRGVAEGRFRLDVELPESVKRHNVLQIESEGVEFRRRVVVYGSDDGVTWTELRRGWIFELPTRRGYVRNDEVNYPSSNFRYVRVEIWPDPETDKGPPTLVDVRVGAAVESAPYYVSYEAKLSSRIAMRVHGRPGSGWILTLKGEHVPVSRVILDAREDGFSRDISVQYTPTLKGRVHWRVVAAETWERREGERDPFVVSFQEVRAAALRVLIVDDRNPPLTLTEVKPEAIGRLVLFPIDRLSDDLRLYFGNPDASEPMYDFERMLDEYVDPPEPLCKLGELRRNPEFKLSLVALIQRSPWIVHAAFALASVAIAATLADTVRRLLAARQSEEGAGGEQPSA